MFKHYFILFFRVFRKLMTSFLINGIGLATGLTCAILFGLWIIDELSFDKFHEDIEQLYQVMENQRSEGEVLTIDMTPGYLGESILDEIPEVEHAVSLTSPSSMKNAVLSLEGTHFTGEGAFTNKNFFNVFSFSLLEGDADKVLSEKYAVTLSEEMALKIFKSLEWRGGDKKRQVVVSGIYQKPTANSTINPDYLLSLDLYKDMYEADFDWGNRILYTYLLVRTEANIDQLNNKLSQLLDRKVNEETASDLFLVKFSDKYLHGKFKDGVQVGGRIEYVRIFAVITIFIIIIASINFMNLFTAKASKRLKEIGVKKAIGVSRHSLILQFIGEATIMAILALVLAIILVIILLPQFNEITGKDLALNFDLKFVSFILGVTLFTGLLSGSYPAFYLSGLPTIAILKGGRKSSKKEFWVRKSLIIFQFGISIIFLVLVWVVYEQVDYMQNKDLGYDKENIISFEVQDRALQNLETFLSELKSIPGVENASSIDRIMVKSGFSTYAIAWAGKTEDILFEAVSVNYDMIETQKIQIIEGRAFSREYASDSNKIIFNEAAIEVMGMEDPIGKKVMLWSPDNIMEITGVVKNFHFESLHEEVKPLFMVLEPQYTPVVMAKIGDGKEKATIQLLRDFYNTYNPGFTFDYKFLDEAYKAQYGAEIRLSSLSRYFGGLALLMTCLGLYGLAVFTAEKRMKEIGVRKAFGASNLSIISLFLIEFSKIVLIANLIALPISYFIAVYWLDSFSYKIDLQWWYFVGAGVVTLIISLLTISVQSTKAAKANPVNCLMD